MTARLTSRMQVDALIRATQGAGGHATVLARGHDGGGAILLECADRGRPGPLLQRVVGLDGGYDWVRCGPAGDAGGEDRIAYLARRRALDPDLWLIELDIPQAERFAAETIGRG